MDRLEFGPWKLFLIARLSTTLLGAIIGATIGLENANQINFIGGGIGALVGSFLMPIPMWICGNWLITIYTALSTGQKEKLFEMQLPGTEIIYLPWALSLVTILSIGTGAFFISPIYLLLQSHEYIVRETLLFGVMLIIALVFAFSQAFENFRQANLLRGKYRILFLRPFWSDVQLSVTHLMSLQKSVGVIGKLVVFEKPNSSEPQYLHTVQGIRHKLPEIELLQAESSKWQEQVVTQIQSADIIVIELAPKGNPNFVEFEPIQPSMKPQRGFLNIEGIHEVGTGAGLLRELDYCQQSGLLSKVIVLVPLNFYSRILEAFHVIETFGDGRLYKMTESSDAVIPMTPELASRDQALKHLKNVKAVIPYTRFGDHFFTSHIHYAMLGIIGNNPPSSDKTNPKQYKNLIGIPHQPLALPPDGKLKNIRFTPLHRITHMPGGEIVELSLEEVKQMSEGQTIESDYFVCANCGRDSKDIFWYQYGKQHNQSAGVHMRCQYCGYKDYR